MRRARAGGRCSLVTPSDYLDPASSAAVDQALSRLTKSGKLRPIALGLHDYRRSIRRSAYFPRFSMTAHAPWLMRPLRRRKSPRRMQRMRLAFWHRLPQRAFISRRSLSPHRARQARRRSPSRLSAPRPQVRQGPVVPCRLFNDWELTCVIWFRELNAADSDF